MSNSWLRLWHDMPNDPKWRTVARVAKQPVSVVLGVYLHILVNASNATERGRTQNLNSEDIASALDVETDNVDAILSAMQGRVLDGDDVSGWHKRQPAREDGSAERAKQWREAKKSLRSDDANAERTQANAEKRPDTDTDKEKERGGTDASASPQPQLTKARGSRLPADWTPSEDDLAWAKSERPDLDVRREAQSFRDYWIAAAGAKGVKLDWPATWRNWIRKANAPFARAQVPSAPRPARRQLADSFPGYDRHAH